MLRAALAALLLTAAPVLAQEAGEGITIQDPYAIQAVPGAPTGAAFMLIQNHASAPDHLTGAASPVADRVEIHTHTEVDGVMKMGPVEGPVEIPAGGLVPLERGGLHVMFLGLHEPLEDGEVIPLTLTFEEAGDVQVEVPVDLGRLTEDAQGGEGDMGAMDHDSMEGMDHGGEGG